MEKRSDSIRCHMVLVAVLLGLCRPVPATALDLADRFDPYEVSGIEVSAISTDAVAAKRKALDEALVASSRRVLKRVAANGTPPDISPETAETLLSSYENSSEKVGTTGYSATYTMIYSPMLVRGFLAKRGIGVVDQPAPTVLLIPLVVQDGTERWWGEAGDWAAALNGLDMEDRLTPIRLPANTVEDESIRHELLLSGDYMTLTDLRIRYGTQSAVVARLDRGAEGQGMLVGLLGEDAAGPVDLTVEVPSGGLDAAANRIADLLAERWRKVAMGQGTTGLAVGNSLAVRALLGGDPQDWEVLRQRLEASGAVSGLAMEGMNGSEANIVIWYTGRLSDLPARLSGKGLDLFEAGGGWLLQSY